MDKLILISKKLGFIDTIENIHHDDSNKIIREKIINRFEDRSYFSYFEKVYVGNTLIYYVINSTRINLVNESFNFYYLLPEITTNITKLE
jgi:hypothetical protein